MKCVSVFSGTRSDTKYFARAGYEMDYVEIKEGRDVRDYHPPKADVVVATPPCVDFSYFNRKFGTWESKYDADRT
ncbi:MAG: DNA cytosine methyltransferase, partial [Thaumarchaeota archaeon]|nr:DNA cytosine methyltransferase [Nitrososphaerota archaeon]